MVAEEEMTTVAEIVAAETIKSLKLVASFVTELIGLLAVDEIISIVIALPILCLFLLRMPQELAQVGCITMMAAILALPAVLPLALWRFLLWCRDSDQHDGNANDSGMLEVVVEVATSSPWEPGSHNWPVGAALQVVVTGLRENIEPVVRAIVFEPLREHAKHGLILVLVVGAFVVACMETAAGLAVVSMGVSLGFLAALGSAVLWWSWKHRATGPSPPYNGNGNGNGETAI